MQKLRILPFMYNGLLSLIKAIPNTKEKILVEIGTWLGESAIIFSKYFKTVITIDYFENIGNDTKEIEDTCKENIREFSNITLLKKESTEASSLFNTESIDILYLDGDHSEKGILGDFYFWYPKVKKDGFICGHDYNNFYYKEVYDNVNLLGKPEIFEDTSWLFKKEDIKNFNKIETKYFKVQQCLEFKRRLLNL